MQPADRRHCGRCASPFLLVKLVRTVLNSMERNGVLRPPPSPAALTAVPSSLPELVVPHNYRYTAGNSVIDLVLLELQLGLIPTISHARGSTSGKNSASPIHAKS